jgi:hypothetical protein
MSYKAGAVNNYNTARSLVRFENKKNILFTSKMLYVAYYNAGVVVVNSKVVGLAAANPTIVSYNASAVKIYNATSSHEYPNVF